MPEREAPALGGPDAAGGAQPQERALLDHRARRPAAGVRVRRQKARRPGDHRVARGQPCRRTGARRSRWSHASALARAVDHAHQLPAVDSTAQHPGTDPLQLLAVAQAGLPMVQAPSRGAHDLRRRDHRRQRCRARRPSRCRSGATSAPGAASGLGRADHRHPGHAEDERQHRHLHRAGDGAQAARGAGVCRAALGRARPRRSGGGGGPAAFGAGPHRRSDAVLLRLAVLPGGRRRARLQGLHASHTVFAESLGPYLREAIERGSARPRSGYHARTCRSDERDGGSRSPWRGSRPALPRRPATRWGRRRRASARLLATPTACARTSRSGTR